jgi:hypothetical protein
LTFPLESFRWESFPGIITGMLAMFASRFWPDVEEGVVLMA